MFPEFSIAKYNLLRSHVRKMSNVYFMHLIWTLKIPLSATKYVVGIIYFSERVKNKLSLYI